MSKEKQPPADEDTMNDAQLDLVSGGNAKPLPKPKPKPSTTNRGGTFGGVQGESVDDKHKGTIEVLS